MLPKGKPSVQTTFKANDNKDGNEEDKDGRESNVVAAMFHNAHNLERALHLFQPPHLLKCPQTVVRTKLILPTVTRLSVWMASVRLYGIIHSATN